MARGPDGSGGGAGFSLKDQLFNESTLGDLAAEWAAGLPGFDAQAFLDRVLPGLAERGLKERLDWIADCIEPQLAPDFPTMADQIEAALPPPLDPALTDNDFGRFIHAVPGLLAVRHGMDHPDRALDLLHAATQRFSMEFYIRPFLDAHTDLVMARLTDWCEDENYHVRRLVSEGTRPKLPWAGALSIDPMLAMPLLDALHADPTRYVTRSVANHMNDLSKIAPRTVLEHLQAWRGKGAQRPGELDWMIRHSLRTAIKRGEPEALALLGYDPDADVDVRIDVLTPRVVAGDALRFEVTLTARRDTPVLVDYRIRFARPGARAGTGEKVFKLRQAQLKAGVPMTFGKRHNLKADATTFRLHPGAHGLIVQVNGRDLAHTGFDIIAPSETDRLPE